MHFRSAASFALLLLAACGPGAADRSAIPATEAVYDISRAAFWLAPGRTGKPLQGQWACEGACVEATVTPVSPADVKEVRSTFGPGGDADRGVVTWRGVAPAEASVIALPVVGGPEDSRTRVVVRCGSVTRTLLHPNVEWKRWRLYLKRPGAACDLEIRASDDGNGWGQWIAIGTPEVVE